MINKMKLEREILHKQLIKLAEDSTNLPDEIRYISISMVDIYKALERNFLLVTLIALLGAYFIVSIFIKLVNIRR